MPFRSQPAEGGQLSCSNLFFEVVTFREQVTQSLELIFCQRSSSREEDDNIRRFFKLTPQDVEMMVKIVEWGKVSAAQVAATLSFSPEQEEVPWDSEEPEVAIGHYLTELMRNSRPLTTRSTRLWT